MTAAVIADALGPKARRRVAIASVVAAAMIVLAVVVIVRRLSDRGQLEWALWEPLTQWSILRFLLLGLLNTMKVALVAMVLAVVVGAFLALGRLSRTAPVRWLTGSWVEFFRGLPLLLLIFFSARGLSRLGVDLSAFWILAVALVVYNGAVLGEIFRAGILSLDRGQSEAASAIGLSYWESMFFVIIPQAIRRMVPALVSQLVTLLKDTSLGIVIPFEELLRRGQITGEFAKNALQTLTLVALIYMVVNMTLSQVARRLEVRQSQRYSAGAIAVGGVEDLALVEATSRTTD